MTPPNKLMPRGKVRDTGIWNEIWRNPRCAFGVDQEIEK